MQECFLQEYLSDTIASEAALFVPYNFPYRTFPGWKHTSMGHRTKRFFQWSGKMGERF